MYIISACLIGIDCKYNGGNNKCPWVMEFIKDKNYILVCPEELGGLPTPRSPVEILEGRAINKEGQDVTDNFIAGAEKSLELAEKEVLKRVALGKPGDLGESEELGKPGAPETPGKPRGEFIELAILKAKSPSCGCGAIYDGTFSGRLIEGNGFFAELLKRCDIPVFTELDERKIGGLINDKL